MSVLDKKILKKFALFLGALGVLFGSVFISFRCGYSKGLEDSPRHFYSVDVVKALNTNTAFKRYVDSLYTATYRTVLDSVVRHDKVVSVLGKWLDEHPGCAMQKMSVVPGVSQRDYERVFFKGNK